MACHYCSEKEGRKLTLKKIYLTERHLQALWLEQKYLTTLYTSENSEVKVLSPGIWNLGPGPDFQKAHLIIAGKSYQGDIELHLAEDSWFQHQHHKDERYNNVILHVALWPSKRRRPILTAKEHIVKSLHLEPFLTVPLEKLSQLIDLELYPYKHFVGAGQCADAFFKHLSLKQTAEFFQNVADFRLERKRHKLQNLVSDPCDYIPAGIAMALGFKNNAQAFLSLFLELKHINFKDEHTALAWLLRKCGFFNERFYNKWQASAFYRQLEKLSVPNAEPMPLALTQIRPLNHPIRRLALLAKLYYDPHIKFLLATAEAHWHHYYAANSSAKKERLFMQQLINLLPNYKDAYWSRHYLFETQTTKRELPLFGSDLKQEIVLNILLPFLAEKIFKRSYDEREAFRRCYYSIPAAKTGKGSYLKHRFFGASEKGSLLKQAYHVQGAYQIHHDYCVHYEASCEGCPFVSQHRQSLSYRPHKCCAC